MTGCGYFITIDVHLHYHLHLPFKCWHSRTEILCTSMKGDSLYRLKKQAKNIMSGPEGSRAIAQLLGKLVGCFRSYGYGYAKGKKELM